MTATETDPEAWPPADFGGLREITSEELDELQKSADLCGELYHQHTPTLICIKSLGHVERDKTPHAAIVGVGGVTTVLTWGPLDVMIDAMAEVDKETKR